MHLASPLLARLIESLRALPGVGPKTAQRMAYHLLERNRDAGRAIAQALAEAMERIGKCVDCRTLSEEERCAVCRNPRRDRGLLCIVETPQEAQVVEQATGFQGLYFVLLGHLSPLDGIGPEQIGLDQLARRLDTGEVREIVVATNPTVEGEATAYVIAEMAHRRNIRATRLAQGVPFGGELEYIDSGTLARAFTHRQDL